MMGWENLDSRNCRHNVAETTRHGRFRPPKSGKRHIDLDETLLCRLERHIKRLRKDRLVAGVLSPYLFPGITQRVVQGAVRFYPVSQSKATLEGRNLLGGNLGDRGPQTHL
jgi:hypothetical protein